MTAQAAVSDRRNTSARTTTPACPEDWAREADQLLTRFGVDRSRSWISRTIRDFQRSRVEGMPFGRYLLARVELNAQQRAMIRANDDLRYLLEYADPTGERAVANVMRGQR